MPYIAQRRPTTRAAGFALFLLCLLLAALSMQAVPAHAALNPSGPPTLVSPADGRDHVSPDVALDAAGNAVVVWQGLNATGDYDIVAQLYDSRGRASGTPFVVNAYKAGNQQRPAVAMDELGNFVVVWEGPGNGTDPDGNNVNDTKTKNIWGRRFNPDGTGRTGDLAINRVAAGNQLAPQIAADADGDYVVAWQGAVPGDEQGVAFARFDRNGLSLSPADMLPYDPATPGVQTRPALAITPGGAFAISWDTEVEDLDTGLFSYTVLTHRYSATGQSEAIDTIASGDAGSLRESGLSFDAAGALLVAWVERDLSDTDGTIWLRRFAPGGGGPGAAQQLSPPVQADRYSPILVADAEGRIVALWGDATSVSTGSLVGLAARELDTLGRPQGAEFYPVLPAPAGTVEHLAAAWARIGGGTLLVVWDCDTQPAGSPQLSSSIYLRRYPGPVSSAEYVVNLPLLR